MINKIINFIHYDNAFTLIVMFIFIGASATFAATSDTVISQTKVVRSVDNTYILNTDFTAYNVGLKINSVKEDTDWYYVDYAYNVAEIVDYVWKQTPKDFSMKVAKKELGNRDLGLYVAEQLGQVADQQLSYLKNIQTEEKKKGITTKVVAVEYSGLVGQFLETKEDKFESYVPVKPPIVVAENDTQTIVSNLVNNSNDTLGVTLGAPALTREEVQALIQSEVNKILASGNQVSPLTQTTPMPTPSSSSVSEPVATTPVEVSTTTPNTETTPVTSTTTPPVADTTPPVVIINGNSPETVAVGGVYADAGATATDDRDGIVAVSTSGTVDTAVAGVYTITYSSTDAAGNIGTATRMVNVQ